MAITTLSEVERQYLKALLEVYMNNPSTLSRSMLDYKLDGYCTRFERLEAGIKLTKNGTK